MSNPRTPDQALKELREKIAAHKAIAFEMLRTLPQRLSTFNPAIMAEIKDQDLFVPKSPSREAFDKMLFIASQTGAHKGNASIVATIRSQENVILSLNEFEKQLNAHIEANEDQTAFTHPDRETLRQLKTQIDGKITSDDPTGRFSAWDGAATNSCQDLQFFIEQIRLQRTASIDHAISIYEEWASRAEAAFATHQHQLPKVAVLKKHVSDEMVLAEQTVEEYERDHKVNVNNYKDDVKKLNNALADAIDTRDNLSVRHAALLTGNPSTEAELDQHIQQCEQLENELATSDRLLMNLSNDNRALADRKTVLDESLKLLTGHGHIVGDSPAARLRKKAALEITRMEKELQEARNQLDWIFAEEPKSPRLPYAEVVRAAIEKLNSSKEVLEKEVNDAEMAQPFIVSLHKAVKNHVEQNNRHLTAFADGVKHATALDISDLLNEYRTLRFEMLHAKHKAQLEMGMVHTVTDLRTARIAKLNHEITVLESDAKNLNSDIARHAGVNAAKARVEQCKQLAATKKAEITAEIERLSTLLAAAKKSIDDLIVLPKADAVPQERFTLKRSELDLHKAKLIQQREKVVAEKIAAANELNDAALEKLREAYEKPKAPADRGSIIGAILAAAFAPVAYFTGLFTAPYDAYRKAKESSNSRVAGVFAGMAAFIAATAGGWFYGIYRIWTGGPQRSVDNDSLNKKLLDDNHSESSSIPSSVASSATSSPKSPVTPQGGYASGNEESAPNSPAVNVHHLHLPASSPRAVPNKKQASAPKSAAHSAPSEWHPTVSQTVSPNSPAATALTRETHKALHTREKDNRKAVVNPEGNSPQRTRHHE